jgi:hypothetical protein
MTGETFPYSTAAAFRTALKDRFAEISRSRSDYTVDELQRQFAYDRALARIFTSADAHRWVLKGAGALLARLRHARHSKDIDVYFTEQNAEAVSAVEALRSALDRDIGDFFRFEVTKVVPLQEEAKGSRVHVRTGLGPTAFSVFHIDVVVGTSMCGTPDLVAPMTPLSIAGLVRPPYRTFPLADHLADKLCATIGVYRTGRPTRSSTRIKDLVDIALIASTQRVSGPALRSAIIANAAHRELVIPDKFAVPDETSWRRGYPKVAAGVPGTAPTFDEAVALASALLNPAIRAPIKGEWDPLVSRWIERG